MFSKLGMNFVLDYKALERPNMFSKLDMNFVLDYKVFLTTTKKEEKRHICIN